MNGCKFCNTKSIDIGNQEGWIDMVRNNNIGEKGFQTLYLNRDDKGIYIYGDGECESDIYHPKYCPECGKDLKNG